MYEYDHRVYFNREYYVRIISVFDSKVDCLLGTEQYIRCVVSKRNMHDILYISHINTDNDLSIKVYYKKDFIHIFNNYNIMI